MNLHSFQFKLHQHNLRYNPDICNMSTKEKVQHYALKITGLCADFYADGTRLENTHGPRLVYAVFSLANFFNIHLIDVCARNEGKGRRLNTFDAHARQWQADNVSRDSLFFLYIEEVGNLCKLAEALDHLEPLNFRVGIHKAVMELFAIAFRILKHEDEANCNNYAELCSDYICGIEDKHLFREQYGSFSLITDPAGYKLL